MSVDPHEQNNLAGTDSCLTVEAQLRERLNRWMQETQDPVLDRKMQRPANEINLLKGLPQCFKNEHYDFITSPALIEDKSGPYGIYN